MHQIIYEIICGNLDISRVAERNTQNINDVPFVDQSEKRI